MCNFDKIKNHRRWSKRVPKLGTHKKFSANSLAPNYVLIFRISSSQPQQGWLSRPPSRNVQFSAPPPGSVIATPPGSVHQSYQLTQRLKQMHQQQVVQHLGQHLTIFWMNKWDLFYVNTSLPLGEYLRGIHKWRHANFDNIRPPSPSATLQWLFNLQLYSDCHKRGTPLPP